VVQQVKAMVNGRVGGATEAAGEGQMMAGRYRACTGCSTQPAIGHSQDQKGMLEQVPTGGKGEGGVDSSELYCTQT